MTPPQRGGFGAPLMRDMSLDADKVMMAALDAESRARVVAIFLPTQQSKTWRVQLRSEGQSVVTTVSVDDKSGVVSTVAPLAGDRTAQWIRWIHEGSHAGPVWQVIVFLCGVFPTIFAITGVMIWLRSRGAGRATLPLKPVPQVDPAE
jgi:uncharacterized iron-regulated membrane protein